MREALALAAGAGLAGLDVPVGAVILGPDGAIVARAHNQREERRDPTAHAEIVALRAAQARCKPRLDNGCGGRNADHGELACTAVANLSP